MSSQRDLLIVCIVRLQNSVLTGLGFEPKKLLNINPTPVKRGLSERTLQLLMSSQRDLFIVSIALRHSILLFYGCANQSLSHYKISF
jgi:hypothetical protein